MVRGVGVDHVGCQPFQTGGRIVQAHDLEPGHTTITVRVAGETAGQSLVPSGGIQCVAQGLAADVQRPILLPYSHPFDGVQQQVGRVVGMGVVGCDRGRFPVLRLISGDKGIIRRALRADRCGELHAYTSLAHCLDKDVKVQAISAHERDVLHAFNFPGLQDDVIPLHSKDRQEDQLGSRSSDRG